MKVKQVCSYLKLALLATAWAATNAPGLAQDLPFSSTSTGVDGPLHIRSAPPARYGAAAAYDGVRQNVVMFGGYIGGGVSDTYVWDGANWTPRSPATVPAGRFYPGMAFDGARQRVLLFGGYGSTAYNDTYTWDGTNWTLLSPQNSPSGRYSHAMAYDAARQSMILFGGQAFNNAYLGDTWSWNGTNWTQLSPAKAPSLRYQAAIAYDGARQVTVLYGGNYGGPLGDTWTWDGANWTSNSPSVRPPVLYDAQMAYDSNHQVTILFGGNAGSTWPSDTWAWDGTNWNHFNPAVSPPGREGHVMAYDPIHQKIVMYGGYTSTVNFSDVWLWDGTNWTQDSGSPYVSNMSGRPNGIWNYTTIDVDTNVTVIFKKNSGNTPVQWLATGFVNINGTLNLNGADGGSNPLPGNEDPGGPGGFAGGLGGIRFDQSGSYAGTPGQGPGGGLPGTTAGANGTSATYSSTYGNAYIQPLIGGSGGGGTASGATQNGFNGGGGGGAIYISSSRDIQINGSIVARGGSFNYGIISGYGYVYAGGGSGGAIRLQADRVSGGGSLDASGGGNGADAGRIRIEAYYRSLASSTTPVSVNSAPVTNQNFTAQGALIVASVAGQNIAQPPGGNTLSPDVVFTSAGPINVTATSTNIPNGTPIVLKVTSSGQVIQATNNLTAGAANFSVTVPAGVGTIQASASFTINN